MKKARPNEERKFNVSESLANSAISKKWPTENAEEKENLAFTAKEENAFTDHCSQLYRLRSSPTLVEDITREINKRDEVYQLVGAQFPKVAQEKYV
jgi:phage repressor protein C with HTH and peptisase S24 domain